MEAEIEYQFMSFIDRRASKYLGACVVKAKDITEGINQAYKKGINPGGEVAAFGLTEDHFQSQGLELNRLYSKAEMDALGF